MTSASSSNATGTAPSRVAANDAAVSRATAANDAATRTPAAGALPAAVSVPAAVAAASAVPASAAVTAAVPVSVAVPVPAAEVSASGPAEAAAPLGVRGGREQIDAISDAVKVPLLMAGAPEALCDPAYLATRRVKAWSAGHQTFSVALKALHDSMQLVRSGTLSLHLPGQASKQLLEQATGVPEYDEWTRQYLVGGA